MRKIQSVAVLGAGTMGTGIAGLAAEKDFKVLLLDVSLEAAEKALQRIVGGRPPALDTPEKASNITLGTLEDDLDKIKDYDWICEAIIEDLDTKRALFKRIETLRSDHSVVSTNTSGIPLHAISEGMTESLRNNLVVTHFFNPVKIMRLLEIVPGVDTDPEVVEILSDFCRNQLGKGIVHAKDTVNFIGNRIGCFWMLMGLHKASDALDRGLSMETIDAVMSSPMGLPPTGFYGLIDLIGLDVMDFVGKNLKQNLPEGDAGRAFTDFPESVQKMLEHGQLGRKSGGGFYRVTKRDDGSKSKETFDLKNESWRPFQEITLADDQQSPDVMFSDSAEGRLAWDIMGGTLCYAADLIPEISGDVVNIDRAMRWGFGWQKGPFELIDALGAEKFIEKIKQSDQALPAMLQRLDDTGCKHFYQNGHQEYFGTDGCYHPLPAE